MPAVARSSTRAAAPAAAIRAAIALPLYLLLAVAWAASLVARRFAGDRQDDAAPAPLELLVLALLLLLALIRDGRVVAPEPAR